MSNRELLRNFVGAQVGLVPGPDISKFYAQPLTAIMYKTTSFLKHPKLGIETKVLSKQAIILIKNRAD